ncbi:MAG: MarR family winged helix-turn-helix transcriptional regulator [Chloroflexota bacterium]
MGKVDQSMDKQPEPAPKPITKAEYETLATFRYVLRQFLHFSEEASTAIGLTPQSHQAMLAIKGFPNRDYVTIGELAERLQIRHHSTVGLVDRMVAQDLVTREPASDQRYVYVKLTDRGANLLEQLTAAHRDELRRIRPQLTLLLGTLEV